MRAFCFLIFWVACLFGKEFEIKPPIESLQKEYTLSSFKGASFHHGDIENEKLANAWGYHRIAEGDNLDNFVLAPLFAMSASETKSMGWGKNCILSSDEKAEKIVYPALIGSSFLITKNKQGAALSFNNPYEEKVFLILEGCLNYNKDAEVFVFKQGNDGKRTLIADNKNPDALTQISNKFPDGSTRTRYYLKLQYEIWLEKNESLFVAAFMPENVAGIKRRTNIFYVDDKWGKSHNPIFYLEKNKGQ